MSKVWKAMILSFFLPTMLLLGAAQIQYPNAKLFAAHSGGSTEDCFSNGEEVYVNGHFWPYGKVNYFITDSGGDWKDLIECYRGDTLSCNKLPSGGVNVLHSGTVVADIPVLNKPGKYNVSTTFTGWNIPDSSKHYRLLAWNDTYWDPQNGDAGSNDSFGCYQKIPEFPFMLIPAGIILGFFFWKKK